MRLCLDAGHGGHDAGAIYKGLCEKDITLRVVKRVVELLDDYCALFLTRSEDVYVEPWKRALFANEHKVDLFISIHCNADPDDDDPGDPVAKGEEIWVPSQQLVYGKESMEFAKVLQTQASTFASVHRGIKVSDKLAVLHVGKMPRVLMEIGFIDDPDFAKHLPESEVANAIAVAVVYWFNNVKGAGK